jgi:KDO2-lipid IV(A) lauroyltransferase
MALRFGSFLGCLVFYLWRPKTKIALQNLHRALAGKKSDREIRTIARKMYQNFGRGLIEFFRLPLLTPKTIYNYVTFEGLEHLEEAHKKGRGVFLLSAHFGNWEMLSAVLALRGVPFNMLARKIKNNHVDVFVNGIRRRAGVNPIEKNEGTNKVISAFRKNEMVGFVLDQHANEALGIPVKFFGQKFFAFKSLAMLARRYKVPIVPVFMIREPQGKHRVVIEPALTLSQGLKLNDSILKDTQHCIQILERYIGQYPDQWIWLHRGWRE